MHSPFMSTVQLSVTIETISVPSFTNNGTVLSSFYKFFVFMPWYYVYIIILTCPGDKAFLERNSYYTTYLNIRMIGV